MKTTKTALSIVFNRPRYWVIAFGVAVLFMVLVTGLAYFSALTFAVRYSGWWSVPRSLVQILWLNTTPASFVLLVATAGLIGINISLMVFHVAKRLAGTGFTSVAGMLLAILGVGCASCGSVVLSTVLGFSAATSLMSVLPLRGTELGLLANVILLSSIIITSKKITNPVMCSVK